MNKGKKLLIFVWIAAVAAITGLGMTLKNESTHFFGIADNREQLISFPHAVKIVAIEVLEGEEAASGALLLRLRRPDLQAEQTVIDHRIDEIAARAREAMTAVRAELKGLEAQKAADLAALDTQIQALLTQYRLNQELLKKISGERQEQAEGSSSPLLAKLSGLRRQRLHLAESLQARIDELQARLDATATPAEAQIAELDARQTELQRQQSDLMVHAHFHGRVGSILFGPGEQVPPFKPIMTLHSLAPQFIKGYVHEDVHNEVGTGQRVWVRSLTKDDKGILQGTVENLGARIVQYPQRLMRNSLVSAWGREVVVRLDGHNGLLLGEKVMVSVTRPEPIAKQLASLFQHTWQQLGGSLDAMAQEVPPPAPGMDIAARAGAIGESLPATAP